MANICAEEIKRLLDWLPSDLAESISALSTRQRECTLLVYVDGYTEDEVADELEIDQSVVNKHLKAALILLRRDLELNTSLEKCFKQTA